MSLNWTENAALDYGATMVRLTAMRTYISQPGKYSEIAEILEHALKDLNRILEGSRGVAREVECPAGWCPDSDDNCDWCVNGNGSNGEAGKAGGGF